MCTKSERLYSPTLHLQEASASGDPSDAQEGKAKPDTAEPVAEPAADATANAQADAKYGLLSALSLFHTGTLVVTRISCCLQSRRSRLYEGASSWR